MSDSLKVKKVFSSRVANALKHRGFWIIGIEPNMKKPWFDVFLFEATDDLLKAYDEVISELSEKEK